MGDSVVLEPTIPKHAQEMQEEDFTTPRVCFAPTIKQAVNAVGFDLDEMGRRDVGTLYVYAVDSIPGMVKPRDGDLPDDVFELDDEEQIAALKYYVPDSSVTGEVWSLRPVRVMKVKTINEEIEPDCWGGSRPDETYSELLEDDPVYQKKSVLVPDDVKHSINSWMKKMGLSKPMKRGRP
jgi:hypothetical protein